jgi:microcystin-dependent protein
MSSPFYAEIRIFPFNFAPNGWAQCDGQLLPISQNTALFSLLGTTFGGDGKSSFGLPDLRGSVPMHPDGQSHVLGEMGGEQAVTLLVSEIPVHTHGVNVSPGAAQDNNPVGPTATPDRYLADAKGGAPYTPLAPNASTLDLRASTPAGGSLPHENMQPFLTLNFCIALQGVFPQRP